LSSQHLTKLVKFADTLLASPTKYWPSLGKDSTPFLPTKPTVLATVTCVFIPTKLPRLVAASGNQTIPGSAFSTTAKSVSTRLKFSGSLVAYQGDRELMAVAACPACS
ncbi:MAG: hypothetical protein ABI977_11775, partial [Acidobacteriota bacterium]